MNCPKSMQKKPDSTILTLHCNHCSNGQATLRNRICGDNIISLLQNNSEITQLILQHTYIKVYQGTSLNYLKELAQFQEEIKINPRLNEKIKLNPLIKSNNISTIEKGLSFEDIFSKFREFKNKSTFFSQSTKKQIKQKTQMLHLLPEKLNTIDFLHNYIRPYVRPGFIDSFIQIQPPPEVIFESTYTIKSSLDKKTTVTLYSRKNSPEKLYFLLPSEYQLSQNDVQLLDKVRINLSKHQPEIASFIDSDFSSNYFKRFAKKIIIKTLEQTENKDLDISHIDQLSNMFSQYTSGLGIIEDLLNDPNIQDIYVNAPVQHNPLHVVVNGDEYTSNIFLSNYDIEALSSRFRIMSGRPFSEANPVLDMELPSFQTRIAAIGQPLTPKGTAFCIPKTSEKTMDTYPFYSK